MTRALLLAPHNDDETLFASFLCLRYQPLVVICYRSEIQETEFGITAETREAETAEAMDIFGCDWRQWPLGDRSATAEEVESFMWGLRDPASDNDWNLVFAPAAEFNGNPQHTLVGQLATLVFGELVQCYTTYTNPPLQRTRDGTQIPYDANWLFLKHRALSCYASQAITPSYRHFAEDMNEYLA